MTQRVTILVVEDEFLIRTDMVDMFEDAGFAVLEAANAEEAFSKMDNHNAAIDLLVTDIRLGDGPDGWDVARRSRELLGDLPIIFVSGDSSEDWEDQNIVKSVMLAKPVRETDLLEAATTAIS